MATMGSQPEVIVPRVELPSNSTEEKARRSVCVCVCVCVGDLMSCFYRAQIPTVHNRFNLITHTSLSPCIVVCSMII